MEHLTYLKTLVALGKQTIQKFGNIEESNKYFISKNKITGTIATNIEDLQRHISLGMKYHLYKVDCGIISDILILKKF